MLLRIAEAIHDWKIASSGIEDAERRSNKLLLAEEALRKIHEALFPKKDTP